MDEMFPADTDSLQSGGKDCKAGRCLLLDHQLGVELRGNKVAVVE